MGVRILCLILAAGVQLRVPPAAKQAAIPGSQPWIQGLQAVGDLAPVPSVGRRGPVKLDRRAFSDSDGTWNAFGTTLFWALWAERNDPERLDRNLATFARAGGDYVRILSMVGGNSWEDRTIDPKLADYWTFVDRLVARAGRHGLRLQVTIFAAAQNMMPSRADRERWIDLWAARLNKDPERFIFAETANEYWQNGIESAEELRDLTARLNRQTAVLVAPSATQCGSQRIECRGEWLTIYSTGAADLASPHFDRDVSTSDGPDGPIHQPWEMMLRPREGPQAYVNNEPIGPESSGASESDPRRLTMAAATTWLAGGAAYTLHTGAGIRGGGACAGCAPAYKARSSNLWEVANITETLRRIAELRKAIPPGLANCEPHDPNVDSPNRIFGTSPATVVRAYHSLCPDGRFVVLPHGIRGKSARLIARKDVEVDGKRIAAGQALLVPAPSAVIVGRLR